MNKRFRNSNKIDLPHDIDQESLLSLYDRESRDLELFNSIDAEIIKLSGSKLFYYKVFINENYDRVYLEERNKVVSKDAIVVWASYDPKPIEENVSEFGLELTNDQVFVFNKSYIERAIGRAPQPGDVVESPVQNIKYEIYEVQEDSFEVYGVFHYNCYGRVLRDSSDVVDEPALETFEEIGAELIISRDYEDLSVAAMTNADISTPEAPPVIVPDPDENILALFASNEVGAWYDPSDLTTVFQDAAGTTPATVGDPVGLILDKSQGLVLGSELVDTANDATAWGPNGSNVIEQDGDAVKITYVDDSRGGFIYLTEAGGLSISLPNNLTYKIQFQAKVNAGAASIDVAGMTSTATQVFPLTSEYQTFTLFAKRTTTSPYLRFRDMSAGEIVWIRNISIRELPGNHATQTTSAARPVLQSSGGLYYLDFDGVDDWMTTGAFASAQAQPNSIGVAFKFDNYTSKQYDFVYDGVINTERHNLVEENGALKFAAGASLPAGNATLNAEVNLAYYNSPSSTMRRNGVLSASGDTGGQSWSGVILGAYNVNKNWWLDGRIYSYVGVNRTLTAAEITDLETYLAAKSGVTLATAPIE